MPKNCEEMDKDGKNCIKCHTLALAWNGRECIIPYCKVPSDDYGLCKECWVGF